jgi:hypothetical protein
MPYTETALLAVFALVIGLVIFGGTTLAAFAEGRPRKRDTNPPLRLQPSPSTAKPAVNQANPSDRAA